MYKIGVSSAGFELTEENFKALSASKIDAIEVKLKNMDVDFETLKAWSDKYNVELWSCHVPFTPFDVFNLGSLNKELRDSTVQQYGELIKKATAVGIDKFVVHSSGGVKDEERDECLKCAMDSLDQLAEIADQYGAVIAVEDLPRTCLANTIDEVEMLVSANDKLRVCLDTNHLLNDNSIDFIKRLGDKIITLHVSDYDFLNERHWLPGEGKNDWKGILDALKDVGYDGVWMYELLFNSTKTITRERDINFDDIYENAMCLFVNEKPKILGTIVEGLTSWR